MDNHIYAFNPDIIEKTVGRPKKEKRSKRFAKDFE